jgi:hypothetical protein
MEGLPGLMAAIVSSWNAASASVRPYAGWFCYRSSEVLHPMATYTASHAMPHVSCCPAFFQDKPWAILKLSAYRMDTVQLLACSRHNFL